MQYLVMINQAKAIEWGLNANQASLMSFVYDLESWGRDVVAHGKAYKWISKSKVVQELPLYFNKADTVHRGLIELEKKGLISRNFTRSQSLVKITDKGREWRFDASQGSDINPRGVGSKSEGGSDLNPTDPITIDQVTIDPDLKPLSETDVSKDAIEKSFKIFWTAGMRKLGRKQALAEFKKHVTKNNLDHEQFATMLAEDIRKRIQARQQGFDLLHPERYIKNERWTDEIIQSQMPHDPHAMGTNYRKPTGWA
ncbi:hypothetical protein [Photobacterium sanguinicancri]|uniref:hypothetical protein n=1 Tax=Photobacterium sanguinicancri TaxID=875932 RepID=UPI003D109E78